MAVAFLLRGGVARADHDALTPDHIADAILGRTAAEWDENGDTVVSPGEGFADFDVKSDGVINVLDLLAFQAGSGVPCTGTDPVHCPIATFDVSSAAFDEAAGTVLVRVTFSLPVTGTLAYAVLENDFAPPDGTGQRLSTATLGVDYSADVTNQLGQVAVNGTSVDIPLDILNDPILAEGSETVFLRLLPGTDYVVGAFNQHVVSIGENDRTWSITMDASGTLMDLSFELTSTPSGETGRLVSDGTGTVPRGAWPMTIARAATTFSATTDTIPVPASATGFGVPMQRTFSFDASGGGVADLGAVGTFSETLTAPGHAYLDRVVRGDFAAAPDLDPPPIIKPALVP